MAQFGSVCLPEAFLDVMREAMPAGLAMNDF
ncbi:hypothetical protein, partial [Cronobacter sakazakii]